MLFTILGLKIFLSGLLLDIECRYFSFYQAFFFRAKPFKDFLIRRINTLIIPFICWMLITASYYFLKYDILAPIIGIQHEPFNPSLLDMTKLFNVHNETVHDPLLINPAMWFLISLPCVQIIFWGINFFLKKKILPILLICTLLHICGIILFIKYDINGLFYIGWTLRYTIYYALGAIIGPLLMQYTQTPKHRIGIICFSIPAIILLNRIHIPYWPFCFTNINSKRRYSLLYSNYICYFSIYSSNKNIQGTLLFWKKFSGYLSYTLDFNGCIQSIDRKRIKTNIRSSYLLLLFIYFYLYSIFCPYYYCQQIFSNTRREKRPN